MTPLRELFEILLSPILLPSFATAGCVAVSGGVLGVPTLLKRHSLAALALPQAVAVGVALSLRWNAPGWSLPLAGIMAAAVITFLAAHRTAAQIDALVAACYVGGLCVSFLIVANAQAHVNELQSRFVGMDVAVDWTDFARAGPALLVFAAIVAALWRRWMLLAQMPAVAELAGLRPAQWHYLFLSLLALMVMVGTSAQGVVMVLAMLFLPAASVLPWTRRMPTAMAAATVLGVLLVAGGAAISIEMEWPFSQSVGGLGFAVLVASRLASLATPRMLRTAARCFLIGAAASLVFSAGCAYPPTQAGQAGATASLEVM